MSKRIFLHTLFLFLSFFVTAQSYRFKHITSEDGLSTFYTSSIIQDDKGFMWFGTQEGLCRYDGYEVKAFKHDPDVKTSLSSSDITTIYQHGDGKIYIGTRNAGLNILNPINTTFEKIDPKILSDVKITCFLKADDDNILIGSGKGLDLFNVKTKRAIPLKIPGNEPVEINCFFNFNGQILVGTTANGLWRIVNNSSLEKITLKDASGKEIVEEEIQTVNGIDQYDNLLYLGTYGGGVLKVDPKSFHVITTFKISEENENINYIEDIRIRSNSCFAITRNGFIVTDLSKGTQEVFRKNESDRRSLNDNYLTSIFIDEQGNIWLGTFAGGVNVAFSQTQKFPNLPKSLSEQFPRTFSIYEDADKNLWIGGDQSLKFFDRKNKTVANHDKIIGSNYVLSIAGDEEGNLWLGTWGLGLFKFDPGSGKKESYLSEELGNTVLSLRQEKGILWIGTYADGLFILDTKTKEVKRFTEEEGLSSNNISTIYKDSKQNIWLGTDGGGAICVKEGKINDKNSFKKFLYTDKGNCISSNSVYSILEDSHSNMWFATSNGVSKYDASTSRFTNYYEKDGLSNNFIISVLSDEENNIWMSSNKGIIRFNPNQVNENGVAFKNYDQKDGLLNNEHSQGAYCKTSAGELVFGGVNGINIFDPRTIKDNYHVPPVYIVSYKRSGKNIETDTAITHKKYLKLSWRENFFQFELAALDYNSPGMNKYQYMLEGYDNDWSAPSRVRYVSYTELPGGDYVFKVKAANNDGVWNENPFYIHITVVPPFWKTSWFYILVSIIGLAAVILFTQYRTRAIKEENKILEHKVAERTKELAEKNRDITSSIQYAKRIQEAILPAQHHLGSLFKNAFILYRPKDIVSGDFYWFGIKNNWKIFAAVDCTGHGVPGAFMSMIGYNLLNQIIMEKGFTDPGAILNELHKGVQDALRQGRNEVNTNDGMDVSLIAVHEINGKVIWAGAFRPMVIVRAAGELEKIDGNKFPIGGEQLDSMRQFTTNNILLGKNDTIYLFSDGYADQFGGDRGKKFMVKRFNDLLRSIHVYSMDEQRKELERTFEGWRGEHEQVDDVLVVGIRF
jgi:ligand-binding sensor domain-containing protein/serine phosphatase RsbU (regulator of sigma subunit)